MIPVIVKVCAPSLEAFGALVRHAGEEFIYVLEGRIEVHTEFYDPVVLGVGESIYIDSNMGHAYLTADGCEEALVLAVNSSAEEGLMESLMRPFTTSGGRPERALSLHRGTDGACREALAAGG